MIADVILPDGLNLNQKLVKQWWCWWYRKYASADTTLERLEAEAREGRKQKCEDANGFMEASDPLRIFRKNALLYEFFVVRVGVHGAEKEVSNFF
jgi:hypothetical protein